jgi:hypothetical protein
LAVQMIRQRKKWVCEKCNSEYLRWQGICKSCGASASLIEVQILPERQRAKLTPLQRQRAPLDPNRKLRRRAKDSERGIAKRMLEADGVDPAYSKIASSTGRVGHITGMRIDAISRSYVTENKNRKMPTWLIDAWVLINQRGKDFGKNVLLHVDPPNMPKEIQLNGVRERLDTLSIITQSRHEELILNERILAEILAEVQAETRYSDLQSLYFALQERYSKKIGG